MVSDDFLKIKSADDLLAIVSDFSEDSIVLLDVDDTLITPVSSTFRAPPYNQLIDEIKRDKDRYPNFAQIVSNWRLQRKVMLVDEDWPKVIATLKEKFVVYGLTKLDSGGFGNIESMERWRINELRSFDIRFSEKSDIPEGNINGASFYLGMFMTGPNTKGQALRCYLPYFSTTHIVLVDDRVDYLKDVYDFCIAHSITFTGVVFQGLQELEGYPDPDIAALQKQYLLEKAHWIEDEVAGEILKNGEL